ncbi:hypothetical protein P3W45_000226 [Vairimorpha bombi]|jgi:hypothetical protein
MFPMVDRNTIVIMRKVVFFNHTIPITVVNMLLSFAKIFSTFSILYIRRKEEVYGSLRIFLFLYAALHTIYLWVYFNRLLFISIPTMLQHINLNIHELILELIKLAFIFTTASVVPYEHILSSNNRLLYISYMVLICLDIITSIVRFIVLGHFILLSNILERNEEYESFKINEEDVGKYDCCAICLEEYEKDDDVLQLICMHLFHKDCITKWLEMGKNCPACKKDLVLQICVYEDKKLKF